MTGILLRVALAALCLALALLNVHTDRLAQRLNEKSKP